MIARFWVAAALALAGAERNGGLLILIFRYNFFMLLLFLLLAMAMHLVAIRWRPLRCVEIRGGIHERASLHRRDRRDAGAASGPAVKWLSP